VRAGAERKAKAVMMTALLQAAALRTDDAREEVVLYKREVSTLRPLTLMVKQPCFTV